MDISKITNLSGDDGSPMFIRHPSTSQIVTHEGEPSRIWVIGKDTKAYRDIKANVFKKYKGIKSITFDIRETMECEILAKAVTKLDNFVWQGEIVEYSESLMLQIFVDPLFLWLREQVDEHLGDRSDFLVTSPTD